MLKSHTVPSGVAAVNSLRYGSDSRLPTAKIHEYDRTLDNVPGNIFMNFVERMRLCDVWFGSGEREIEFVERQILRHGRSFGHDLEWVAFRWVRCGPVQWSDGDCLWDG